ncbi:MAG TPA: GAF domain-containing protein [Flavitalea sp.]|nr:GAF domain-containing protein [Flavitalea sp.]
MSICSSTFLEKMRLQDLNNYDILDSGTEEAFENLVELAQAIMDCPIAAISFVDSGRLYAKAVRGLTVRESPRELSFCCHTIRDDKVMVVMDATLDPRFRDNPFVVDRPGFRFYAGAPIITNAGFRIGTVCLVDFKPREFKEQNCKALEQLSRQVSRLLELRLENKALQREAEKAVQQQIALVHQVVQRQEEQNFFASNELHENIAQELAAAKLYLDMANPFSPGKVLTESRENLTRLIERTKGLSMKMYPSTFPSIRLDEMIEDLANRFMKETGIAVALSQDSLESMGKDQRIILFRIIEEQFKNIQQHSCAKNVTVRIAVKEQVEVFIMDDGIGYNVKMKKPGYGISKMLSLTQYYGGDLQFFEPHNRGCGLRISMPVVQ